MPVDQKVLLALAGVAFGWLLKVVTDYLVSRKAESRTYRRACFYVLRDYKALFDYERGTAYFRASKPPVADFEPWRATLEARFLEASEANGTSVSTAIDLVASLDPPLAIRLHNSLNNLAFVFRRNLTKVAMQDEETYAGLLYTQEKLVEFTLQELADAALFLAARAGKREKRKLEKWLEERTRGTAEFLEGMREQAPLRTRAFDLGKAESGAGA